MNRKALILQHISAELTAARTHRGEPRSAWQALQRAHVLSQGFAGAHVRVHWAMLRYGIATRDLREVGGQLIRILAAGPASLIGRVPLGNTGRARVRINQPMPIPEDLALILRADEAHDE
jgi:hypothetical protein